MTCSSIPEEHKGNAIRVLEFQNGTRRHVDDAGVSDALVLEPADPHFPAPYLAPGSARLVGNERRTRRHPQCR